MAGVLDELLQNVRQNDSDWKNVKDAIVRKGVPVPDGTPTSEYGEKILSIGSGSYEDGIEYAYNQFWDAYQQNGERSDYNYAFSYGWSTETFKPKYPIAPEGYCDYMFYYSKIGNEDDPDFDFVERGIELDLSKVTRMTYGFAYARGIKRLGVIDFTGYTANSINRVFWVAKIVTIDKLVVTDNVAFDHTFDYASKLVNLIIEGTIGKGGLNLSWSPLSKDSLISVVNALSSTTTGQPVTLRLAAVNTAFETSAGAADGSTSEEWTALIATKPNWTINLINSV